ncbi:MAG: hypothetical protein WC848_06470 [Parcubacteria group bacterium]|jgi:hypothetical protein
MKIKILLAPSLIVLIIVTIIWYAYPAYTNGVDGVKERSEKLVQQESLMSGLDGRISNANKLVADLDSNSFENSVVFNYVPVNTEEEKIIDNLNSLAKNNALSVLNISVFPEKETAVVVPTIDASATSYLPVSGNAGAPAPVTPKAVPKNLEVNFSVLGEYENIKSLLGKIQKLKRFDKVSALTIKTLINSDQVVSASLQADITLEFNYLDELKRLADGDIDNDIFVRGAFDKQVIGKIKDSRNIDVNNVLPGERGGNNPFNVAK